jgi:Na+/melibiose symporter-like transporter
MPFEVLEGQQIVIMSKSAKVLVTIGAIFLYIIIATPILAAMKESGQSSGFVGLILLVALIGAIRAIWKKSNNDKGNNNEKDSSVLQK